MSPLRVGLATLAILASRPVLAEDLDAPEPDDKTRSTTYEYQNDGFSLRLGGGLLIDYVHYWQSEDSKDQLTLFPEVGIRDLRALVSGRLFWPRLTYTLGYMLDVAKNSWRFRQTGLRLQIAELGGDLFIGRTKEGFSTNKFMVGYYGWFNERSAANDAFLPILADGARWTASVLGGKLVYNVGMFADPLSDRESFNKNDWQFAARAVWLPLTGHESGNVLHLAGEVRYAGANDGLLQYKSKPEAFLAQKNAVDTGEFAATTSTMLGFEVYYASGPFLTGLEYYTNKVTIGDLPAGVQASATATGDPFFHGGDAFATYVLTGEAHPYNTKGGFFGNLVPDKSFFAGGWGAWELAVRCSYVDLDSEGITGGRFARASAQVNWYLTETLRFEAVYGYGVLDRFDVDGGIQFFQTRVQIAIQ